MSSWAFRPSDFKCFVPFPLLQRIRGGLLIRRAAGIRRLGPSKPPLTIVPFRVASSLQGAEGGRSLL